jgi:signal transduction histidine kinase
VQQAVVWGALLLAAAVTLALPTGYGLHLPFALPLVAAAAFWRPRAVGLLALLVVAADVAAQVAQAVPAVVIGIGVTALGLFGALAVEAARLRLAVRRATQARDAFVAAAAHDLKNPLTVVRGQAQLQRQRLARLDGLAPAQRRELEAGVARIDGAARRTLARLNELLDAVRLHAGEALALERRPTDLVALAHDVAATYQAAAADYRIAVQAAVPELVGAWDGFRLERVLENLVGNAIKYSPAGGEITIAIRREAPGEAAAAARAGPEGDTGADGEGHGGWAVLAVRDEGVGIPAADLERIFEPYARGRNVVGVLPGSGIGLAGARRIVEQHGGRIGVASTEGRGSTFTVRLPLPAAEASAAVPIVPTTDAAGATGRA